MTLNAGYGNTVQYGDELTGAVSGPGRRVPTEPLNTT